MSSKFLIMKRFTQFIFLIMIGALSINSQIKAQYSLDFNGEEDHVVLNGSDLAPPWSMEVMVNINAVS